MGRILRLYVIRAIVTPMLMALMTITFILMVEKINEMIDLIMQPGVRLSQVAGILIAFLPSMVLFAAPMAALVGTLIGVGRLVMDREILAMRASGINLLSVFAPALIAGLLISGSILFLAHDTIPRTLKTAMNRTTDLSYAFINTLRPGQKYTSDKLNMKDTKFDIYFQQRDEKRHEMRDIVMKLNPDKTNLLKDSKSKPEKNEDNKEKAEEKNEAGKSQKSKNKDGKGSAEQADKPTSTSQELAAFVTELHQKGLLPSGVQKVEGEEELIEDLTETTRENDVMTIFAKSGRLTSDLEHGTDGRLRLMFQLALHDGSLHLKSANPEKREYVMFRFEQTTVTQIREKESIKETKIKSSSELRHEIATGKKTGDDGKVTLRQSARDAKAELTERKAMPLAFFTFVLFGIPLAIRVRTGGKSWAILLAIGMMLVYFVLMQWGLAMVQTERPFGLALAFFPNLLFIALGSLLWWQTLRS